MTNLERFLRAYREALVARTGFMDVTIDALYENMQAALAKCSLDGRLSSSTLYACRMLSIPPTAEAIIAYITMPSVD